MRATEFISLLNDTIYSVNLLLRYGNPKKWKTQQ